MKCILYFDSFANRKIRQLIVKDLKPFVNALCLAIIKKTQRSIKAWNWKCIEFSFFFFRCKRHISLLNKQKDIYDLSKQFYYFWVSCNVSIRENGRIKSFVQLTHNGYKINTKVHILVDINLNRTFSSPSSSVSMGKK